MTPEHPLNAPGMADNFYLNLVLWSAFNVIGVALSEYTYIWGADTGVVSHMGDALDDTQMLPALISAGMAPTP